MTNNDKFKYNKSKNSIFRNTEGFGFYSFISIKDNCQKTNKNYALLEYDNYVNSKYRNETESYIKLNGNKSCWMIIEEWECFQV